MLHPLTDRRYRRSVSTTEGNIHKVQGWINEGALDPNIRAWALRIVHDAGIEGRDDYGEVAAILDYVQRTIPFRRDIAIVNDGQPVAVETLQQARAQMRAVQVGAPGSDCDDFTILSSSLLQAIGHPVRLAVTRPAPGRGYSHIYPEVYVHVLGEWLPFDASNRDGALGWESEEYYEKRVIPMNRLQMGLSGPIDDAIEKIEGVVKGGKEILERAGVLEPKPTKLAEAGGFKAILKNPVVLMGGAAVIALLIFRRR